MLSLITITILVALLAGIHINILVMALIHAEVKNGIAMLLFLSFASFLLGVAAVSIAALTSSGIKEYGQFKKDADREQEQIQDQRDDPSRSDSEHQGTTGAANP